MKHREFSKYMIYSRCDDTREFSTAMQNHKYIITQTGDMTGIHKMIGKIPEIKMLSVFYNKEFFNDHWESARDTFIKYYFKHHIPDILCFCDNEYLNVFLTKRDMDVKWIEEVLRRDA